MPEGDTIWRAARALHAALAGHVVTAFRSPLPAVAAAARRRGVVGSRVSAVEPLGKHLLVRFSAPAVLHTHMGMRGSWHLYRPGSRWLKPARLARAVVETPAAVAVCFSAPLVEMLSPAQVAHHPRLARLGPDVLGPAFPRSEAVERLRARPRAEIGDALIDQTALAGIGNVYKSEVLFLCAVDPFAPVVLLEDDVLPRLVAMAEKQMRRNLQGASRRTASALAGPRFWVYGRAGRPCRRCGTPILMRRQGLMARSTYWCPRCQPRRKMPEP